ncbi:NAD(P)-dependent oxidoreductase [Catenulispora subtropica]|uniref:NAD(P)H-binding protein n=1 Tax=Catenulispora subtropica TaxID=450798 RepID=A0ABN2SCC9_9ACTN
MKIVLFGATGMIGSRIAAEAAARGHSVTAVSRSGARPKADGDVTAVSGDAGDREQVATLVKGADVVASALVPARDGSDPRASFVALYHDFLSGVRAGGGPRTVIVGGAGSLRVAPGLRLVDTPDFPPAFKPEALAHADVLDSLRANAADLPMWTYISPAPQTGPGVRTGAFRVGVGDDLLPHAGSISAEDFAAAFVDEVESGAHPRQRLSVAQTA